jgi:hypothetical protein
MARRSWPSRAVWTRFSGEPPSTFPAKAGTQTLSHDLSLIFWIPAFAGKEDETHTKREIPSPALTLTHKGPFNDKVAGFGIGALDQAIGFQ